MAIDENSPLLFKELKKPLKQNTSDFHFFVSESYSRMISRNTTEEASKKDNNYRLKTMTHEICLFLLIYT
jgi:hypothetical protein